MVYKGWIPDKELPTIKEIADFNGITVPELRRALNGCCCMEDVMVQIKYNRERKKELEGKV